MKNCLTCKYEPLWPKLSEGEYPRQMAPCRWNEKLPIMPVHYMVVKPQITMHSDKSGLPVRCKAWVVKEPK